MNWRKIILGDFSLKRLFFSSMFIYALLTLSVHLYAAKLIFPYQQSSYNEALPGLSLVKTGDHHDLATRFWKADNENYLILYFHGNYLDLGHLDDIAEILNTKGYSVLAMDYRGYGLSTGEPTEDVIYDDAKTLLDLAHKMGYQDENVIVLGRSVGTGIATELALHAQFKLLVLISPYASTYRVMTTVPVLLFDKFNNLAKMPNIKIPLFIVHGSTDNIIAPWHSEELIQAHLGKKQRVLIDGAGHNDIWQFDPDTVFQELAHFID
jgi:fermentation-respiration switch protein FrsA (DUF1100 family)